MNSLSLGLSGGSALTEGWWTLSGQRLSESRAEQGGARLAVRSAECGHTWVWVRLSAHPVLTEPETGGQTDGDGGAVNQRAPPTGLGHQCLFKKRILGLGESLSLRNAAHSPLRMKQLTTCEDTIKSHH